MKGFLDSLMIFQKLVTQNSYVNCSDREPKELKPKNQYFDKTIEKIVDTSNTVGKNGGLDISFGIMFQTKYKIIMIIIINSDCNNYVNHILILVL
jgi:hypothetical protein